MGEVARYYEPNRLRRPLSLVTFLLAGVFATPAHPQQSPSSNPAMSTPPQELAKSVHNPFEDFIKIPFQSTTGFNIGPHHNVGDSLNVQPLLPITLGRDWDLFARPSLSLNYQPTPHEQFGLIDLQSSFFLSPHNANEWVWGLGPIFQFPTATSTRLGTRRWSAGPTAALIYSNGPWFGGVLTYQLMSFAGDRARGSVNQTYLEPEVSYNLNSGWYGDIDPPITFDWTADAANGWTIPIGADLGKAFTLASQAMGLQLGAYDLLKRPDGTPQWVIRVQLTLLFPAVR
jgi:hypothetical protein